MSRFKNIVACFHSDQTQRHRSARVLEMALFLLATGMSLWSGVSVANAQQVWLPGGPTDNWNTTDSNWDAGVVFTPGSSANFGGISESVTLNGGSALTVNEIIFSSSGYTITGGGGSDALNITGAVRVSNAGHGATISANISSGLAFHGPGSLNVSGTVSGNTSITAGTLSNSGTLSGTTQVSGGTVTNLGTMTGVVTVDGGTFTLNAGSANGGVRSNGGTTNLSGGTAASLTNAGGTTNVTGAQVTGTTTINSGTVVVNGTDDATLELAGTTSVNNGGTLTLTNGDVSAVMIASGGTMNMAAGDAGAVTNAGSVSLGGGTIASLTQSSGSTMVTGSSTVTGLTDINGGTLTVNSGQILTATNGVDIASGATGTLNGTVSGNLTNTGTTNIAALGSLTGNFSNSGSGTNTGTIGGTLTNSAGTFSNSGTISGTTTVSGGTVTNTGTMTGLATVNGGRLQGTGTFGGILVNNGGTLAVGNSSVGTLTVNGNLSLTNGSTLMIDVRQGGADQIDANGTVSVSGATIQFADLAPALSDATQTFTIIDNDGSDAVIGSFGNVVDNLAFLTPSVSTTGGDGNDVVLSFATTAIVNGLPDLTTVSDTSNQTSVAAAFADLDSTNTEVKALADAFTPLTNAQSNAAVNTLTGEVHATTGQSLSSTNLFVGNTITNIIDASTVASRLGSASSGGQVFAPIGALAYSAEESVAKRHPAFGAFDAVEEAKAAKTYTHLFAQGLYRHATFDSDGNGGKTTITNSGIVFGAGRYIGNRSTLGLAGGYVRAQASINNPASTSESDSGFVNLFLTHGAGAFDFIGNLGYMRSAIKASRDVRVGTFTRTAQADYGANNFYGTAEIGYTLAHQNMLFRPFVSYSASLSQRERFTETGAGAANLTVHSSTNYLSRIAMGFAASAQVSLGDVTLVPRFELAYDRLLGDTKTKTNASFALGTTNFSTSGTGVDENRLSIRTGTTIALDESRKAFLDYNGIFAENTRDHTIRGGLKLSF